MKKTINEKSFQQGKTPVDVFLGRAAMVGFMLAFSAYLAADVVAPGLV